MCKKRLSYSLLADVQENVGLCVCDCACVGVGEAMSCGNCKSEVMRCAVCQTRARGMWLTWTCSLEGLARPVCLRPVRLGSESIDQPNNHADDQFQECDTTRSAACVVSVIRKQSPPPTRRR